MITGAVGGGLCAVEALGILDSVAEDNAVFCVDPHLARVCAALEGCCGEPRRWLAPRDVPHVALSLAIAAQLADLDRQVIALTGVAGGRSMLDNLPFLDEAQLPLKVVVLSPLDTAGDLVARARASGAFASAPDTPAAVEAA
ncbi:MAG: hypothetical protein Q7T71_00460, partial [Herbiconiux sp.]|nr:hypothetical protein [Herbiconiux sp.]